MNPEQTIALYQPMLYSIALRIVGSFSDAEDIVQDTFLKWLTVDKEKINNTKSYLIKAVTNNSINHLQSLKRKKDEFFDTITAGELIKKYSDWEFPKFDIENEIAEAMSIVSKKLEPLESAIFILREVFEFDYEDLQEIFDKKKDNCRQIFCRAKEKLNQTTKKIKIDFPKNSNLLESFKNACSIGSPSDFIAEITKDISAKFNN